MSTESGHSSSGEVTLDLAQIKPILVVIHGLLTVPTYEKLEAQTIFSGFKYLLAREFRRQQPALALLYDLDFSLVAVRRGSYIFEWKILVKLKDRVFPVISEPGSAVLIAAVLSLPGAINESIELWHNLMPPVQTQLQCDVPHSPPVIVIVEIRPPDDSDTFRKDGGRDFSFEKT